ncbi:TPA: hypothetical protein SVB51_001403 [Streptococcus equi subsp. equi]|nr:hypothetical protein [Streptococcus equi subsp. equi]HEK9710853.1 hypothetical protein [Streptococcus equi subsp. equi]HEK9727096.1 hypothetical protein [Streptococcus equi subsp. equi]HEK9740928.1 hypothetical protein [Streptococcus equi subsp. equi]HEK9746837.1 hypothetical protein [Streptococcus equi subsp. equi]
MFKKEGVLNYRQLWWLDKFLVGHKGFIAGGCFKNIFNNDRVKDLDIFFECEKDFLEAKSYYKKQLKESPTDWRFSYENKNCWSIYSIKETVRIELIRNTYGTPKSVISNFDFTVTKFAYYKNYENVDEDDYKAVFEVLFHEKFFEHLHMKRLVVDDRLPYPVNTFNRLFKYVSYGYQPCRETKLKIVTSLAELNPYNQDDIEQQLGKSFYNGLD